MKNIYVGNLSFKTTQDELRDLFAQFGDVSSVNLITDRMTGQSKGFGFVVMETGGDEAIEKLNQTQIGGRTLTVNEARPREERPAGPRRSFGGGGGAGDRGDRGGFGGGRGGRGGF
jgi:RNA recognition motif-containing protein